MEQYFNYHKHTYSSNVSTIDSTTSIEEYAIKSKEYNHKWISSCEHGGMINFLDTYTISKKYNLKYIHCGEFYFVRNRLEKDKSNYHIIVIARNNNGFEMMNEIMSEANETGYYYKPRIDLELLLKLNKEDVYITTACVGGFLRDDNEDLLNTLLNHFGDSLFLEVQPHDTIKQIEYNQMIKELSKKYNISMVGATDSHMITEKQIDDRDYLLKSKGIFYNDEDGWFLDFPSYQTLFERFKNQRIWEDYEIVELLKNTLVFTETEDIIIDVDLKVPTIFRDKDRQWRLNHIKSIIFDNWEKYKHNVDESEHQHYIDELMTEYDVIEDTKMEDYFLTNYYIIKLGKELGGILTETSRGSGASYLLNLLLGFTTIDRLKAKVPILRERFLGKARILDNLSPPDIDFNVYNREAFVEAQNRLLGTKCNYPMVAFGTLGIKSAFKMLCRAKEIDIDTSNEISKTISTYLIDKKHNDEAKIEKYIKNKTHLELIRESEIYNGIIVSVSQNACGYILDNKDIRKSIGLLRTPKGEIVANITKKQSEQFRYLKNDLLIVSVIGMNNRLYNRIKMKQPSANELYEMVKGDKKVWDLYANGYTICLNQMESSNTTQKVMQFRPLTVEELCNFVAIIRPACKSIYKIFERRELFEYGIPELDMLLQGEFLQSSLIIYQEQIMLLLSWLGFDDSEGYAIMKAISKKDKKVIHSVKSRFEERLMEIMINLKIKEMRNNA